MTKLPKGWRKVRDTSPTNRGDYYENKTLGATVHLSHTAHCWLVSRNGRGVQSGEYTTERTAIAAASR